MSSLTGRAIPRTGGITFPVDDVTPAESALPVASLAATFQNRSGRSSLVMPESDRVVAAASPHDLHKKDLALHGLIEAVHLAFCEHRPLVLSPDDVWLTIVQGFGHHINENAEKLRHRMVTHAGRRTLEVQVQSLRLDAEVIGTFSALIRECSDPVLHETLVCDFSTTTPIIRTASEVALMDTYQRYFEYQLDFICGIPEITIEGTADDWRRIRARVEVMDTYELGWWTSRLRPILDEFVAHGRGGAFA